MRRYALYGGRRLLFIPVGIFIVITLAFAIVNLMPGNPARVIAGGLASPEQIEEIKGELGLDRPIPSRYADYVTSLAHGDLGRSFYTKRPVLDEIWEHLPNSLELVALALALATVLGLLLGGVGAYYRDRLPDRISRFAITSTQSIPDFFLGLILIYVVFFLLGWAPAPVGRLGLLDQAPNRVTGALIVDTIIARDWELLVSVLRHSILPVLTLGLAYSAYFAKTTRAVLGAELAADQVEFARACGLPERKVLGYAFRAARTPIITYGAILVAALVGGLAIVETVFAWQGLGQWAVAAILKLDIPAMQGFILTAGLFTLVVFLVLDLVVMLLDPRVSYG